MGYKESKQAWHKQKAQIKIRHGNDMTGEMWAQRNEREQIKHLKYKYDTFRYIQYLSQNQMFNK